MGPYSGQNTAASSAAPISSVMTVTFRIKPVIRTIPPTCGADIASCIVLRCIRLIFRPEKMVTAAAVVTTPMPPTCIRSKIINCPKYDQ